MKGQGHGSVFIRYPKAPKGSKCPAWSRTRTTADEEVGGCLFLFRGGGGVEVQGRVEGFFGEKGGGGFGSGVRLFP